MNLCHKLSNILWIILRTLTQSSFDEIQISLENFFHFCFWRYVCIYYSEMCQVNNGYIKLNALIYLILVNQIMTHKMVPVTVCQIEARQNACSAVWFTGPATLNLRSILTVKIWPFSSDCQIFGFMIAIPDHQQTVGIWTLMFIFIYIYIIIDY